MRTPSRPRRPACREIDPHAPLKEKLMLFKRLIAIAVFLIAALPVFASAGGGGIPATMTGSWHYVIQPGGPGNDFSSGDVNLKQTGNKVAGVSGNWRFVGTLYENSIDLSIVVAGEEVEGYVLHAEGHVLRNRQIFTVYTDVSGVVGSFTAQKN